MTPTFIILLLLILWGMPGHQKVSASQETSRSGVLDLGFFSLLFLVVGVGSSPPHAS